MFKSLGSVNGPKVGVPLFYFDTFYAAFCWIGFDAMPIANARGKREAKHPKQAMSGDHPTGFLHWGAKCESAKHCFFEIGDYAQIVRFDFRVNYAEKSLTPMVQLDELVIENGGDKITVDCSNEDYIDFISNFVGVISQTVACLNRDETDLAKDSFRAIQPFVQKMYENDSHVRAYIAQQKATARLGS